MTELLDRLIADGLNNAKRVGKTVASNGELMTKLKDEAGAAVEITEKDLLGAEDREPGKQDDDHPVYYCKACAAGGKTVELDIEEPPDHCPECGDKLSWESEGNGGLGLVALGILGLAFLAGRARSL